jgi:hypothetical protein
MRPGSPAPTIGPGIEMKVSGPVPKEKVALVTDVAAVTPLNASVKVAGPTVEGLKFKGRGPRRPRLLAILNLLLR